ncbi:MAG: DUF7009 family protein [Flavobacteriales bacterium]|jgi:hypothetical protein
MKVRISDQSLRIRISPAEAQQLSEGNTLQTHLQLNTIDVFSVTLQSWNLSIGEVHAEEKSLMLSIPNAAAQDLAHQPGYTFSGEQQNEPSAPLKFSVEIDLEKAPQP